MVGDLGLVHHPFGQTSHCSRYLLFAFLSAHLLPFRLGPRFEGAQHRLDQSIFVLILAAAGCPAGRLRGLYPGVQRRPPFPPLVLVCLCSLLVLEYFYLLA